MANRRDLVLIVDNDQAVRDALQFALQLEGYRVHVHSGAATLLQDPDLSTARCVILDERMQHMDGFALLDTLRHHAIDLPSILLTSNATSRIKEKARQVGVQNVLEKPLLDNTLFDTLRGIMETRTDTIRSSA